MKKLLPVIVLSFITVAAFSQTKRWGIRAGINTSNQSISGNSAPTPTQNLTGFNLGGILDIDYDKFSIQPGLFYTTKGRKYKMEFIDANQTNPVTGYLSFRSSYIELPVNFLYKFKASSTTKIYVGGGPFLAYGISRTTSTSDYPGGANSSTSSSFGGDGGFRNPDYGLNGTAGVEVNNKIIISANYGYGLSDLSSVEGVKLYNRTLSFSVGYLFK